MASITSLSKSGVVSVATCIVVRTSVRTLYGLTRGVRTSAVAAAKSQAASALCRRQLHSRHRLLKPPSSIGCAPSSRVTIVGNRLGTVGGGGGGSCSSLPNGSECNFLAARGRLASSAATAAAALVLVAGAAACGCNLRDDDVYACNNAGAGLFGSSIASCTAAAVGHAQQSISTTSQRVSSDLQRCTGGLDEESEARNRHINNKSTLGCTASSSSSGSISNSIPGGSICRDLEQQREHGDFCALKLEKARENLEDGTAQATAAVGGLIRGITDVYLFDGDAEAVGKGSRGVVSSARHRLTGQHVAVKKLPRSETTRFEVMQEVMMLKVAGRHPNVVTLQAFFEDQDSYYIVMDLCEGGELRDHLVDKGRYSEGQAARIMAEVAEAVGYLHRHGIVHFDLKPENIMLAVGDDCVPEVRLADFGSAFRHHREMFMARDCTLAYSAPEVLAREAVDEKVDMWALGVVMWVLLTGKHPFVDSSDLPVEDLIRKVTEGELDLRCQAMRHVSPEGKDLVRRLLAKNPEDRPSASQMLSHPWLRAVIIRSNTKNTTQRHQQRQ